MDDYTKKDDYIKKTDDDTSSFKVRLEAKLKNGLLKEARLQMGKSQKEIADMLGIHPTRYSSIECMQYYPDEEIRVAICDLYHLDINQTFPEQLRPKPFQRTYVATKEIAPSLLESLSETQGLLAESIETKIEHEDLATQINISLGILKERDADIMRRIYGLAPYDKAYSLKEISKIYNLSDGRVGQIHEDSLSRIRHNKRTKRLRPYLGK